MGASCAPPPPNANGSAEKETFDFVPQENFIKDINSIFKLGKILGSGVSCSVYVGRMHSTQKKYAVKEMRRDDEFNPRSFRQEVDFLTTLSPHPNVLKYHSAYVTPTNFYIVTELCTGGALFDRIRKLDHFTERKAADLLRTLILTMKHCHSKNIVHRDLKPENIVFETPASDANIVVIDFGDAARIAPHEIYSEFVGTIYYIPPEITRHRHGWELKKSDMWTIGVIAYVLVTGKPPFFGKDNKQIIQKITIGKYKWPSGSKISRQCKKFVRALLTLDPHKRLSPKEALDHPFLNGQCNDEDLGDEFLQNLGEFYSGNMLKRMIVNNMIVDMSREEKKVLIRAFREIDKDRNGYLEENEIIEFLKKSGKSKAEAVKQAKKMMKTMDPKGTGKVSLQDFVRSKTVSSLRLQGLDAITRIYDNLCASDDIDGLAAKALKKWMLENDETLTEQAVDDFISKADKNGDGVIDFEEFQVAFDMVQ